MTKFVVLESKGGQSYARIHRVGCSFAKEPGARTRDTVCHGPFDSFYEARDFARSLGREVRECTICGPRYYHHSLSKKGE